MPKAFSRKKAIQRRSPESPVSRFSSKSRNRASNTHNNKLKQEKQSIFARFLAYDNSKLRFQFVAIIFIFVWAVLWARAWQLQILDGPYLAEQARKQYTTNELVDGRRGTIYDRNGQVLARSVEVRSLYANPKLVENVEDTAIYLAGLLGISEDKLKTQLSQDKSFVWIARKIDDNSAEQIRKSDLPGLNLHKEYERVYPFKHLAGQLLGFVGLDGNGLEGIERSYDDRLTGMSAHNTSTRDGRGRAFFSEDFVSPHGEDLNLTLDVNIQFIAEEALANTAAAQNAKWGGVLVIDVASGDTLAYAQYPFFNPNNFRVSDPNVYRNRLAADALEPGSTFKPFLIAAALESGAVTPETEFFCENGIWETKYITIRDDGRSYGKLSVDKIMRYSSNIGCAKIAATLGASAYHKYISQFGFGQRTGIGIGESKGILRNPKEWSEADLYSSAFGQSLSVTGLQMAQGFLILANEGNFQPLKIILDEENSSGAGQNIISKEVANEVIRMMRDVVEEDGTGGKARINGVQVAGKTGTAQKAARDGKGIKDTAYGSERLASFVGILPADDPKYLIIVMIDEPVGNQYGGAIAAPIFQVVASQTMSYSGDFPDVVFAENTVNMPAKNNKKVDKNKSKNSAKNKTEQVKVELASQAKVDTSQVPNLVGKTVRSAIETLADFGQIPELIGEGVTVAKQSPEAGTKPDEHTNFTLWLSEK